MDTLILTTTTIPFTATAVEPIHHGAGTSGNTAILRTQEAVGPDGKPYAVPFVSGNSLRHTIRAALADHFLDTVNAPQGSLSKGAVDLLYSGGALTKAGANVDLETPRRVAELLPFLTLLGYSAGSHMQAGKLFVDNIHLVCAENAWRLPATLATSPQADRRAGTFRGEEFGTRHDAGRTSAGAFYTSWLDAVDTATTQMIYELQVIKPGAIFFGSITGTSMTDLEASALTTGLACATGVDPSGRFIKLGAKRAVGFGKAAIDITPEISDTYVAHLREHGAEALALLEELVA